MMLVLKDIDGFRWIDGNYDNHKVMSINCQLEPGEYFIVIIGEWENKIVDITLNYQGNV